MADGDEIAPDPDSDHGSATPAAPILGDCPKPAGTSTLQSLSARLTPQQFISFYSPDQWEEFVRELAEALDEDYVLIKRLGGPTTTGSTSRGSSPHSRWQASGTAISASTTPERWTQSMLG